MRRQTDGPPAPPTITGGNADRDQPSSFLGGIDFGMGNFGGIGQAAMGRGGYYRSGDENLPVQGNARPEDIASLQQALIRAGLLDPDDVVSVGMWGRADRSAFRRLLEFANLNGLTWQEALTVYSDTAGRGGSGYGGGGSGGPAFQAQVTNPDDLRLALRDASATLRAGGAFDDATIERLIQVYQAQEVEDQRAAFDAELSGAEQAVAPRSAETILRETIRNEDPSGVGAREVADRYQDFLAALGSPVTPTKL